MPANSSTACADVDQTAGMRVQGSQGITTEVTDGVVRIGWRGHEDWLGAGRATGPSSDPAPESELSPGDGRDDLGAFTAVTVATGDVVRSVRTYSDRPLTVFRASATTALSDLGTGAFDQPSMGWPIFTPSDRVQDGAPEGLRALAFQHCEFGLPSLAGADLDGFFLLPHRPPVGWPLVLDSTSAGTLLIAPLDNFHEHTIGLNGGTVRCGWHGDLATAPAGFTTHLAVIAGDDPRSCLDEWGSILLERAGTVRPGRWADSLATRPSYWTDNGAAYWYKTEPGHDVAGSIVAAVDALRDREVPVGAVQLDSWFYPHVDLRPFDTEEWVVPPSALVTWEERSDVLPDGISDLRSRLGDPPMVAHIRHLSSDAPIASEVPVHVDGPYAAPATPEAYERWLDQCLTWGVETFEHDWLVEVFFGVRGLREEPGRARAWQEGIDRAARDRGITLQWCMGTPADFAQTVTLSQVTSVRTCGDHGYIATAGQLWAWFCVTNALARSLGLMPFKDVFRSDPDVAGDNGEPEALISVLSTGPVGMGDRAGRDDADLVRRTCRADGVLIKPHVPVAATGRSMLSNAAFVAELMVAECHSDQPAGRWGYVLGLHTNPADAQVEGDVVFAELGESAPTGEVVVWDWRARTATPLADPLGADGRWAVTLAKEDWAYLVVAPVLAGGRLAVIGDVDKFVPAGDARIEVAEHGDGVRLVVKGAGETVTVTGWASASPSTVDGPPIDHDPETGVWTVDVDVPGRGWTTVELRP